MRNATTQKAYHDVINSLLTIFIYDELLVTRIMRRQEKFSTTWHVNRHDVATKTD